MTSSRALVFAAIATVLLAACRILPQRATISLYAPDTPIATDPAWPDVDWQLLVARPYASELLDSARIVVRPVPGEVQVYQGARWAQPAPELLQGTLLRGFEDSGRIPGVARQGGGLSGDYRLLLDLRRFEADYAGAAVPSAVIEISARLVAASDGSVVASRTFRQATPATTAALPAVVQAFDQGLAAVGHDIVGWTLAEGGRRAPAPPRPAK